MRKIVIVFLVIVGIIAVLALIGVTNKDYIPKKNKLLDSILSDVIPGNKKQLEASTSDANIKVVKTPNEEENLLKNKVEMLEKRLSKLEQAQKRPFPIKIDLKKWDCWCALRKKLELGEDFDFELKEFKKSCTNHQELLKMVEKLTVMPTVEKNNSNSLVNSLLKFARIKKIDKNELLRISGYVLMLTFTMEAEDDE